MSTNPPAETRRVGHDIHFLRRLERADASQTEMALSLYRDSELVRHLLQRLRLPDGSSHVAFALANSPDACHVLVARDGHFVTCLGPGMSPHPDEPVISRERLDAVVAKVEDLRARTALAEEMGGKSETERLFMRIFEAGHRLSREEFLAASACQPVLATTFLRWMGKASQFLDEVRPAVMRIPRPNARNEDLLLGYWNEVWAMGHLMVLATMGDLSPIDEHIKPEKLRLSWLVTREGVAGVALRAAWAAGRLGKRCLPLYRRAFASEHNHPLLYDTTFAMVAIAARNSKLRAEVVKAFGVAPPASDTDHSEAALWKNLVHHVGSVATKMLEGGDGAVEIATRVGRVIAGRDVDSADPPDDVARAVATHLEIDPLVPENIIYLLATIVWAARAKAEELYVPRAYLDDVLRPWEPGCSLELIQRFRARYKERPVVLGPKVGRNEPCPCGSGKKFKRCCETRRPLAAT